MTKTNPLKSLMMGTLTGVAMTIAFGQVSAHALGVDDITLGEPAYGGTGCPSGSASAVLSPDQKSLSILFDEYLVEAGGESNKRLARKSCNIAIPVHIPQGYSISIFEMDYRGYVFVPQGGQASFNAEYFFAGQRGPRLSKRFRGGTDEEYLISDTLGARAMVWSKCGADVNLRVNTSMLVRSNSWYEEALATVDSADVQAGLVYHIQWKRCGEPDPWWI